jgi:hypothetical protein
MLTMDTLLSLPPESAVMVKVSLSLLYFIVTLGVGIVVDGVEHVLQVVSFEKKTTCRYGKEILPLLSKVSLFAKESFFQRGRVAGGNALASGRNRPGAGHARVLRQPQTYNRVASGLSRA